MGQGERAPPAAREEGHELAVGRIVLEAKFGEDGARAIDLRLSLIAEGGAGAASVAISFAGNGVAPGPDR